MKRLAMFATLLLMLGAACRTTASLTPVAEVTPLSPTSAPTASPTLSVAPPPISVPGPEPDSYWVTNPTSGARLYVRVVHPTAWDGHPLPALLLVPGGSGDCGPFLRPPSKAQRMADAGLIIIVFDPDGRGRSEGVEDNDGFIHQDGLAAVIRFAATLPEVDPDQIGLVSYSYGVTMATGALARYPDLPVRFLIDWEGPADRNDTGGCDEAHVGHLQEHPCDDEAFWSQREAATFALRLAVPYQRIQSEEDHVQPDNNHALLMIANATAQAYGGRGMAPWTRLNDLTPNTVYDIAQPPPMLSEREAERVEPLIVRYALELFGMAAPSAGGSQPTLPAPAQAEVMFTVGAAPVGTIRPLLGVNIGPIPSGTDPANADLTAQYQQIGVTMIRTHDYYGPLDMGTIYPNQNADPADPASYHFEESDRVFRAILDGGFEPYLRLGDSWEVPGLGRRAPTNPANWTRAAVEVVRHYRQMAAEAGIPLRYVEVWNEPDHRQFWDSSPLAFFELFAHTVTALKAEFPDLRVGGPALTPAGALAPEGQRYTRAFLEYMQAHSVPLDFFSWHMYSDDPADYRSAARFYRQQLDAYGFSQTESHVTEWNTRSDFSPLHTSSEGAALMSAAWIVLQEEGVAVSTFYRGPDPDIRAPDFYGMFYADGQPKPVALAFSLWAQMAAHPLRLGITASSDRLWALAGQNEAGEIALLIVNTGDTPTSWEATFAGRAVEGAALTLYQVSDAAADVQTFRLEGTTAEIGAHTVQCLIVSR